MDNEELIFNMEWLVLEKYHFKILTMIVVLADNKRAFRGKLSDLCKELSIQTSTVNLQKLKTTLAFLEEQEYINILVDKDIYTISLTKTAEKESNVQKIKRQWYKLIRNADSDTSWENVLKVFLVLLGLPLAKAEPVTYQQIADSVNCSKATVSRAIKTICDIDFGDFYFDKTVVKTKTDGTYHTIGTIYAQRIDFE